MYTGTEITDPELKLMSALANGPSLLDCMFFDKAGFEGAYGLQWHGLGPKEILVALAKLVANDLVCVSKKDRVRENRCIADSVFLGLSPKGGALWEDRRYVRWEKCMRDEAGEGGAGYTLYHFRSVFEVQLSKLARHIEMLSPFVVVVEPGVISAGVWRWSNWKIFEQSYLLTVRCKSKGDGTHLKAKDSLFAFRDRLTAGFVDG